MILIEQFLTYLPQILPYIFGGGGLLLWQYEKKKRKVELQSKQAGALQSMQQAYDNFVKDNNEMLEALKEENRSLKTKVAQLESKIIEISDEFKAYRNAHKKTG